MEKAVQTKQVQLKQLLLDIYIRLTDGRYGRGDNIDAETLHDDLEEFIEDDFPQITGYGK